MSVTVGPRTAALLERTEQIEKATAAAGTTLPDEVAQTVAAVLTAVRGRLALGVDHTVVALAGGTGSGKSSLFNALAGLTFADVGVRRPTTSEVTACVWAHDATALLDWLGVPVERRIERESALDGESQADLRGLVLLDLPDHDSVEPEHRAVVDRLLPLADLIVWVVDPQKYADDALHTGYLRHLVGHEAAMLVVLNQMDTVPRDAQVSLLADVGRLLREDGLTDVAVHGVSARTGEGVRELRAALAGTVAAHGLAEVRAAAELDDAARVLAGTVAPAETPDADLPTHDTVEALATAGGLAGAERTVRTGAGDGAARGRHLLGPVHRDRVADARRSWVDHAARGLPQPWADRLEAGLMPPGELAAVLDDSLAEVHPPRARTAVRTALRVCAGVVGLAALVVVGLCIGAVAGTGRWTDTATLLWVTGGAGLALALALVGLGRVAGRAAAGRRADELGAAVRARIHAVVEDRLGAPTRALLAEHRQVRVAAHLGPPVRAQVDGPSLVAGGSASSSTDPDRAVDSPA